MKELLNRFPSLEMLKLILVYKIIITIAIVRRTNITRFLADSNLSKLTKKSLFIYEEELRQDISF
jgi:hypothetical protein